MRRLEGEIARRKTAMVMAAAQRELRWCLALPDTLLKAGSNKIKKPLSVG
jgi:hypothetical protein